MTFEKRADGCWHWIYIGANNHQHARILWLCWLFVMLLLFAVFAITTISAGLPGEMLAVIQRIALGFGLFVTLIFVLIWLWERFARKTYAYAADEEKLTMSYGRYRRLYFKDVKSLTTYRERNAIIIKGPLVSVEVLAADDDFEAVWNLLRERCPGAES